METIIRFENVSKSYYNSGEFALKDLNLSVQRGSVLGIIGPNGSGKTTLLSIILGLAQPTSGSVIIQSNLKTGAFIESPDFYHHLTAKQNLGIVADIKGLGPGSFEEILQLVGLSEASGKKFGQFSLGMKQRLGMAAALLGEPDLIILDEPTNGLDPLGIRDIREIINGLARSGKTIIITSHILTEIDILCSDLLVLHNGVTRFSGSKESLFKMASDHDYTLEQVFLSLL